jgi:hypothetical protein
MTRSSYLPLALLVVSVPVLAAEAPNDDDDDVDSTANGAPPSAPSAPVPFNKKWLVPYFTRGLAAKAAARFRSGDFAGASKDLERLLASLPQSAIPCASSAASRS